MKNKILDLFFPKSCPSCGEIIPFGKSFCNCHGTEVKRTSEDFCEHCGSDKESCCCFEKSTMKLPHITAPFVYTGEIKARLLMLKFAGEKGEADFLGNNMALHFASAFPDANPDFITFVPMTFKEKNERGYNQSQLLAERVAKAYFQPCKSVLKKVNETERQHTLPSEKRIENLKNSFEISNPFAIRGKTILICDDIKTTGTTLKRCCDVLFENGAKDVYCLCCAISDYVSINDNIFRS